MKLYHGSTVDIQQIELAKSKPNKDFGRAFSSSLPAMCIAIWQKNWTLYPFRRTELTCVDFT